MADDSLPQFAVRRLGTTRWRAPGEVRCARFAPDGKRVIAVVHEPVIAGQHDILLYESASGARISELHGHAGTAQHAEFSPDGASIASCGFDGSINLWAVNTGQPSRLFYQKDAGIDVAAFSRDGVMVVSTHWHPFVARVWDRQIGKETARTAPHEYTIQCLAVSRDAAMLATSCSVEATMWSAKTGEVIRRFDRDTLMTRFDRSYGVVALDFTPDNKGLVVVKDQTVRTYNVESGDLRDELRLTPKRDAKAFASSDDGACWATGSWDGTVELWDPANHQRVRELVGHTDSVNSLHFSRDGKMLVSGAEDHTIRLWNVATAEPSFDERGHQHVVNRVAFATDDILVSAANDGRCRIWDVKNGSELRSTPRRGIMETLAVSADGKIAYTGGMEGRITGPSQARFWDIATAEQIGATVPHDSGIREIVMAPATRRLITADTDASVRIWDLQSARLQKRIGGFGGISSLAISHDEKTMAVGCRHGVIALWGLDTALPLRDALEIGDEVNGGPSSLAFSADGKWLASASDGDHAVIKFWRTSDYAKMGEVKAHGDYITAIAFSPDSRLLASAGDDYTVRLWRVEDLEELCALCGHDGRVTSVAFSPNGKLLASGSHDTTILVWDVQAAIGHHN